MKINRAILLFLLLFNSPFAFGQTNIDNEYVISLKAFDAIRANDIDAFKALMDKNVLKTIKEKTLINYVSNASEIVQDYDEVASREFVLIGTSNVNYQSENINLLSLSFPFPPPNKPEIVSDQHIIFIFSDDLEKGKIVGFKLRDFAGPARQLEEEAKKTPHLKNFDLKVENLSWFRIWYEKGPSKNDLGNASGVYALSGDNSMLEQARIKELFSDIFTLINSPQIDSTDINYSFSTTTGSPEYLYVRMTFDNPEYKELGEFSIFTVLTAEKDVDEKSQGYIILKHSKTHRYFIEISKHKELYDKLRDLAHRDYGSLLERNP